LLKMLSFVHHMFLVLCEKSGDHTCVDSYLHLLFYSPGLHVFLCHYHAVFIAIGLENSLKPGIVITLALLCLLSIEGSE
jgi:hypothetical protein